MMGRGRYGRILKRTSHIIFGLSETAKPKVVEKPKTKRKAKAK
jgi:hypothetical protein